MASNPSPRAYPDREALLGLQAKRAYPPGAGRLAIFGVTRPIFVVQRRGEMLGFAGETDMLQPTNESGDKGLT